MNLQRYEEFNHLLEKDNTYKRLGIIQFVYALLAIIVGFIYVYIIWHNITEMRLTEGIHYFIGGIFVFLLLMVFRYNNKTHEYLADTYPEDYKNKIKVEKYKELETRERNGEFRDIKDYEEYKELKGLLA